MIIAMILTMQTFISNQMVILWWHYEETRELPGERDAQYKVHAGEEGHARP